MLEEQSIEWGAASCQPSVLSLKEQEVQMEEGAGATLMLLNIECYLCHWLGGWMDWEVDGEYKEKEKEGGFSAGSAVLKATPAASRPGSAAPPQAF